MCFLFPWQHGISYLFKPEFIRYGHQCIDYSVCPKNSFNHIYYQEIFYDLEGISFFLLDSEALEGRLVLTTYEIWKVLVSLAIFFLIVNFHFFGLFIPKKFDALVGRVKTCHILVIVCFKFFLQKSSFNLS
jgi:hypothetical protein